MNLTKEVKQEYHILKRFMIQKEDEIYNKRLEIRRLNIEFNKAKKRIKELMNKDLN